MSLMAFDHSPNLTRIIALNWQLQTFFEVALATTEEKLLWFLVLWFLCNTFSNSQKLFGSFASVKNFVTKICIFKFLFLHTIQSNYIQIYSNFIKFAWISIFAYEKVRQLFTHIRYWRNCWSVCWLMAHNWQLCKVEEIAEVCWLIAHNWQLCKSWRNCWSVLTYSS